MNIIRKLISYIHTAVLFTYLIIHIMNQFNMYCIYIQILINGNVH
jgi:hypothetical protein